MTISEERADRIFKALGALEAGLVALEKAKADRTESGALGAHLVALDKGKADRVDLVLLQQALTDDLHATVSDLQERISDRFNATNSQILGLKTKLDELGGRLSSMAENDTRRGAEISRVGDALNDLAKLIADQQAAAAHASRSRWRRYRAIAHAVAQYGFQAFAGIALLIMLLQEGVTGLPQMLGLVRAALGLGT